MPSPFLGMDPYIEQPKLWPDFHNDLAAEIRATLNQVLQPRYFARLTPYVTYEMVEISQVRGVRPDVGVLQPQPPAPAMGERGAAVITPAPVVYTIPIELTLELYNVEVRTAGEETLVLAIEIMSPVNKQRGHHAYLEYQTKRRDLMRSAAHFMEIDLLRGGVRDDVGVSLPRSAYRILLNRATDRSQVEVWPIALGERLPVLPVPLVPPDPDVPLDLNALVAAVYARGAYATQVDYRHPPRRQH